MLGNSTDTVSYVRVYKMWFFVGVQGGKATEHMHLPTLLCCMPQSDLSSGWAKAETKSNQSNRRSSITGSLCAT